MKPRQERLHGGSILPSLEMKGGWGELRALLIMSLERDAQRYWKRSVLGTLPDSLDWMCEMQILRELPTVVFEVSE